VRAGGEQARVGKGGVGEVETRRSPGREVRGKGFDDGDGFPCGLELDAAPGAAGCVADSRGAGAAVSCRIIQGDDPLGYSAAMPPSMLYGKPHTAQEWLEATADTEYPDLVPQIMAYFDATRAGDILVFAAPGWDFHNRNKAGHGGVRPGEMVTVMLLAGRAARAPHKGRPLRGPRADAAGPSGPPRPGGPGRPQPARPLKKGSRNLFFGIGSLLEALTFLPPEAQWRWLMDTRCVCR